MTNTTNIASSEINSKLKEEFGLVNDLELPRIEKVVIASGVAEAITNQEVLEKVKDQLSQISGQKPKITRAKKAIDSFKLKANDPIGVMVTLRGKRASNFLEKLIAIVMPRIRDFRGLPETKFDKFGNYTLGLAEQIIFPEIDYAKIDKIRGLSISIVIKNSTPQKSKRLLELLGVPFRKV